MPGPAAPGSIRPNGAIVTDSGQRRWSALVEVKTGNNQTNTEQVLKYVVRRSARVSTGC
jgi:hypothetical protein